SDPVVVSFMPCRSASAMSSYRCSLKAEGCEDQQTPKGEQGAHGSSVAMVRGIASHNEIRVLSKLLIGMMKIHNPQLPAQLSTSIKALAGTCEETIVIPKSRA